MGLRRYRELLGVPGVAPLMVAAFVGRLPYGMNILAAILLLRAAGFDYAEVGIVTAASGLSVGAAAPVMGASSTASARRGCCSSPRRSRPSAARSSWWRCSTARARRWSPYDLAPASAVTASYSWQIVGYVAGSAVGAWLAGALVEHAGVGAALACAPLAAATGLLLALAGRRSLVS